MCQVARPCGSAAIAHAAPREYDTAARAAARDHHRSNAPRAEPCLRCLTSSSPVAVEYWTPWRPAPPLLAAEQPKSSRYQLTSIAGASMRPFHTPGSPVTSYAATSVPLPVGSARVPLTSCWAHHRRSIRPAVRHAWLRSRRSCRDRGVPLGARNRGDSSRGGARARRSTRAPQARARTTGSIRALGGWTVSFRPSHLVDNELPAKRTAPDIHVRELRARTPDYVPSGSHQEEVRCDIC
jgi:hypothetical protein